VNLCFSLFFFQAAHVIHSFIRSTKEMRVMAAQSFNEWLSSGDFVPAILQALADPQAPEVWRELLEEERGGGGGGGGGVDQKLMTT